MIDRRAFLRRLGFGTVAAAAAATGVLDVDKLLWTPGKKTIFLPPPPTIAPLAEAFNIGDVFTIEARYAINSVTYKTLPFLQRFVVTAKTEAGQVLTANTIYPPVILDGIYKNISAPVPDRIDGKLVKPLMWGDMNR